MTFKSFRIWPLFLSVSSSVITPYVQVILNCLHIPKHVPPQDLCICLFLEYSSYNLFTPYPLIFQVLIQKEAFSELSLDKNRYLLCASLLTFLMVFVYFYTLLIYLQPLNCTREQLFFCYIHFCIFGPSTKGLFNEQIKQSVSRVTDMNTKVAGVNWEDSLHALESIVLKLLTLIAPLKSIPFHTCISQGTFRPSCQQEAKSTSLEMKCVC